MAPLPIPTSSAPGGIPGEGTGRLINALALKEGTEVRWFPAPGLDVYASPGRESPRGGLLVGGTLYIAREDSLFTLSSGGTIASVGRLDGARPITMARNNRASTADSAGPDIVAVTEIGPFVITQTGATDYPGAVIGVPNSVTFQDGYFVFSYSGGVIRATGLNTLDLNDQSYTVAEAKPDGLYRVTASGGQIWAWGTSSIEVLDNTAAIPFPFARSQVLPVGLFGPWCVAGFEDGWDGPQIFVAADGTVRKMDGYEPTKISTRAVERSIATASGPNVMRACVYTFGGSAIWSLSGPGFTWEFNTSTGEWHERCSASLDRWRAETSVKAFGKWLLGDIVTGDVVALNERSRREGASPLVARIESGPLRNFPDRIRIGSLTVDIATGQGDPAGTDPVQTDPMCSISWSHDGGAAWAEPLARRIGGPGNYGNRVAVGDLGRSRREGVRVAIEVSDPVAFSLRGMDLPDVKVRRGS